MSASHRVALVGPRFAVVLRSVDDMPSCLPDMKSVQAALLKMQLLYVYNPVFGRIFLSLLNARRDNLVTGWISYLRDSVGDSKM